MVKENMIKSILKKSLLKLPSTRSCDLAISLIYFYVAHKRLPIRKKELLNDYHFWFKNSKEMDDPLRQLVSDKDLVKLFYKGVLDQDLAPKTLAKFYSYSEFDLNSIPNQCIIKPSHLSGGIFYDAKKGLTQNELYQIKSWFETNIYYDISRERNYKNLTPCVICEELIENSTNLTDYKVYCYKGEPKFIVVDIDRHEQHKRRFYTVDWQPIDITFDYPLADIEPRPRLLSEALDIARDLSKYFSFMRVDFYLLDNHIYLGELTSVPANAHGRFKSLEDERYLMKLLLEES